MLRYLQLPSHRLRPRSNPRPGDDTGTSAPVTHLCHLLAKDCSWASVCGRGIGGEVASSWSLALLPRQGSGFATMSGGRRWVQEARWLPEERQRLYELAVSNPEHTLCLTSVTAAVWRRNTWWEGVARTVSALSHHHRSARDARKWLQDTLGACKRKLQGATACRLPSEETLQQLLWGTEAVLQPLMQRLLVEGQAMEPGPGVLCLSAQWCGLFCPWTLWVFPPCATTSHVPTPL